MPNIINYKYKCYLIGSMETPGTKDGGVRWRRKLTPRLKDRGVWVFDPTREEINKIGMPTKKFGIYLSHLVWHHNWEQFITAMDKIWLGIDEFHDNTLVHTLGDLDYVAQSDFLIWNLNKGDNPGGTIIELTYAFLRGVPVYLITTTTLSKMNKSWLWAILSSGHGQGRIFKNQSELLKFLDKKYQLRRR